MTDDRRPRGRGRPRSKESPDNNQRLRSVDRALCIFSLVSREVKAPLNVISATAGLAPSTTHRILETLRAHRMVFFDELTQTWSIGVEAFRIGQGYARRISFLDVSRQLMRDLTRRTGETSNLGVLEHQEAVTITQIESDAVIRAFMPPGSRCMPHASGVGKCLLAFQDADVIWRLLDEGDLPIYTEHTLHTRDALDAEFLRVRNQGWSLDDEERAREMRCIAAPIFNEYREPVAALSISGPKNRMSDDTIETLAQDVRHVADTITHRSGGRHPDWHGKFKK